MNAGFFSLSPPSPQLFFTLFAAALLFYVFSHDGLLIGFFNSIDFSKGFTTPSLLPCCITR